MNPEYDPILEFDQMLEEINNEPPVDEMKEVLRYLQRVAKHQDMDPRELYCQILMDWAYNRKSEV